MAAASDDGADGQDIQRQLDEAVAHRRATAEVLELLHYDFLESGSNNSMIMTFH